MQRNPHTAHALEKCRTRVLVLAESHQYSAIVPSPCLFWFSIAAWIMSPCLPWTGLVEASALVMAGFFVLYNNHTFLHFSPIPLLHSNPPLHLSRLSFLPCLFLALLNLSKPTQGPRVVDLGMGCPKRPPLHALEVSLFPIGMLCSCFLVVAWICAKWIFLWPFSHVSEWVRSN